MKVYMIDDGESHWVVAENEEDAMDCLREPLGMTREEFVRDHLDNQEPEVVELPRHKLISIRMEEGLPSALYSALAEEVGEGLHVAVQAVGTAAEWAKQGRGIIGSTVY